MGLKAHDAKIHVGFCDARINSRTSDGNFLSFRLRYIEESVRNECSNVRDVRDDLSTLGPLRFWNGSELLFDVLLHERFDYVRARNDDSARVDAKPGADNGEWLLLGRPAVTAKAVGLTEMALGIAMVLTLGIAWKLF